MDCTCILLALLSTLASLSPTMGCFCDHYPWSTWSQCTKTCDSGTQSRLRAVQYDDHWLKNSCSQLCQIHDNRVCNVEACPINCQLTEFGPWSECSSCAKKSVSKTHTQFKMSCSGCSHSFQCLSFCILLTFFFHIQEGAVNGTLLAQDSHCRSHSHSLIFSCKKTAQNSA